MVDFSEAERSGFISAFVMFWTSRKDTRSQPELEIIGQKLLKGCLQHFQAGVTRLAKISGVVVPEKVDTFRQYIKYLQDATDVQSFKIHEANLVHDFPKTAQWIKWWTRRPHAQMIFLAFREMNESDWESIPDTTNAEEAMHFTLYKAVGKDNDLLTGLKGIFAFCLSFQRLHEGALREEICYMLVVSSDFSVQKGLRFDMENPNLGSWLQRCMGEQKFLVARINKRNDAKKMMGDLQIHLSSL